MNGAESLVRTLVEGGVDVDVAKRTPCRAPSVRIEAHIKGRSVHTSERRALHFELDAVWPGIAEETKAWQAARTALGAKPAPVNRSRPGAAARLPL